MGNDLLKALPSWPRVYWMQVGCVSLGRGRPLPIYICICPNGAYECLGASIINTPNSVTWTTEMYSLIAVEARSQKSRCRQGGSEGEPVPRLSPGFWGFDGDPGLPRLVHITPVCLRLHMHSSCVFVCLFFSFKAITTVDLRSTLIQCDFI